MVYLTYSEYMQRGGSRTEESFTFYLRYATRKLDYFTHDRLKTATVITDDVKDLLVRYIDLTGSMEESKGITMDGLSSYSNGIESMSFGSGGSALTIRKEHEETLLMLALEYLPVELVAACVGV